MKIVSVNNILGLGGTEKAACRWALGLRESGHDVVAISFGDGPRRHELQEKGIPVKVLPLSGPVVAQCLKEVAADVIHAHSPGHPHMGDVLGEALVTLPKIPVVQTNVFGHLDNPKENTWTDFRLFISWTSCVQAARRVGRKLDEKFFERASVAIYPLDAEEPAPADAVEAFRQRHSVMEKDVLFGRLSRPDPAKWTNLALDAFRLALRRDRNVKLLLREPPPSVAKQLRTSPDARHFIILPATSDVAELRLTLSALDVVLHTSSIGESFGYGIAEPMNLGKPVITHSVPWHDQAQIELVRSGECGFVASTPAAMAKAITQLARGQSLRERMGAVARQHIRQLADPAVSTKRLATVIESVKEGRGNPFAVSDLQQAVAAAAYLDQHQFGRSFGEQWALRSRYSWSCFRRWRKAFGFARSSQN